MEIRKGPYGQFVINKIEDIDSVNSYTREIIVENIPGHMLPLYIIPAVSSYEASYDCSDYISLQTYPCSVLNTNRIRKALGDLFFSFADFPDFLLAPSSLCLDPKFMFIDEDLSEIRVCFDPRIISPSDLCIGSIKKAGLRELLNSQCMEGILQPDEIDGLLYAAEQNDEDLFRKESQKIMVPLSEPEKTSELLELPEFKMIILASILSLIFTLIKIPAAALIFVVTEVFFAVKIRNSFINRPSIIVSESTDDTKRQMLFGKEDGKMRGIEALVLTSTDPATGQEDKKAIYTDKAAIGSDRFLCDVFYPDKGISPIHVQVKKVDRVYYVSDLSSDNSTYLNNIRLLPGREYEIKSDQTLMCGKREFKIEIL